MLRKLCVTATLAAAVVIAGSVGLAQTRDRGFGRSVDSSCDDGSRSRRASYCEIREDTISGANPLDIDASPNGGIRIRGWDRADVLVRSKIYGHGDSDAEARRLVSGVRIDTAGGRVRADYPDTKGDQSLSISFDIQVPRTAILTLNSHNGGISIDDFRGTAKFRTQNGGVTLRNVGGDLRGETTNGGVTVDLEGDHWDGPGLDVETHNGGVRLTIPANYSAELETGTVNGRISVDFPVTVLGRLGSHLTTTLGAGGPKVKATTTNGGITVRRR